MRTSIFYSVAALLLLAACARPYRSINMSAVPFSEFREEVKIKYSVRQGVSYNMKNLFTARKEQRNDISLMALNIVNISQEPIPVSDLQFSCGATVPIAPISKEEYYSKVKQKAELYWLYSAGVVPFKKGPVKPWLYFPVGVVMGGANYGIAHRANKKLSKDLDILDISGKVIMPGDSLQGILPFRGVNNCGDIFITVKE